MSRFADLGGRNADGPGDLLRGIRFEESPKRREIASALELAVFLEESPIDEAVVHDDVSQGVEQKQVRSGNDLQESIRPGGGGGSPRIDDHHLRLSEAELHPLEEHRMALRRIGSDHEIAGRMIEVLVAPHRLVLTERRDVAEGGGGHAQARIPVDVVGAKAGLEKLIGDVRLLGDQLAGLQHAARAWDRLEDADYAHVLAVTREQRAAARVLFTKYDAVNLSLVDCVSFAVMKEFGMDRALTFDEGFRKAGFRVLPERRR